MFKGAITALITPFAENGEIDVEAYQRLIDWQIAESIDGLVPVGTTGESPVLSHAEHKSLVEICVAQTKGRVPVIAGAGSNSTREAIDFVRHAEKCGADGVLVVTPYYNKPNQEGLYAHFSAVAKATLLPLIIYNIPSRSVIDMSAETMGRLAHDHKNIVGVKDATGRVERVYDQRIACGDDFAQLSGEDASVLGFNAHGGVGVISVTANIAPRACASVQAACRNGDYITARQLHDQLMPLHKALFLEPNPAGVKYAAAKLGLGRADLRLPLVEIASATKQAIDVGLLAAGLISS